MVEVVKCSIKASLSQPVSSLVMARVWEEVYSIPSSTWCISRWLPSLLVNLIVLSVITLYTNRFPLLSRSPLHLSSRAHLYSQFSPSLPAFNFLHHSILPRPHTPLISYSPPSHSSIPSTFPRSIYPLPSYLSPPYPIPFHALTPPPRPHSWLRSWWVELWENVGTVGVVAVSHDTLSLSLSVKDTWLPLTHSASRTLI